MNIYRFILIVNMNELNYSTMLEMLAKDVQHRLQKVCDTVKHISFVSVVNNVSNATLDKAEQFYKEDNERTKCVKATKMPKHSNDWKSQKQQKVEGLYF